MIFRECERPPKNRRHITDTDLDWDQELEDALRGTLVSGKAIVVALSHFHSSPAKGRLWKEGFRVTHRVLPDRETVAAWLIKDEPSGLEAQMSDG